LQWATSQRTSKGRKKKAHSQRPIPTTLLESVFGTEIPQLLCCIPYEDQPPPPGLSANFLDYPLSAAGPSKAGPRVREQFGYGNPLYSEVVPGEAAMEERSSLISATLATFP